MPESQPTRVLIWNEFREERDDEWTTVYPDGIHRTLAEGIRSDDLEIATATLDEPEHGLTDRRLDRTDVVVWWGHIAHAEVDEAIVARVHQRVLEGMGLVVLHSAAWAKVFRAVMGTDCDLVWRSAGPCTERLWVVNPTHPIAAGLDAVFTLDEEEAFEEWFVIPEPEELVFVSWFSSGEIFRSGCCYRRGRGRVFYFRPGHEAYPTYRDENVLRVIGNAVRWAAQPRLRAAWSRA